MWTRESGDWFHRLTNGCWNKPSTTLPPSPLFPILNSSFSPPFGAISGAAIGELGTKGKDAPIALKWSLHPILHCQLHCTEQICILYCSKLHCSSAVQLQCRLSAQIDSLASPKSYRSCKMNTATALAGLEAMRDPVQHSRRKPIALQCNLTIIKVIVLQMELSACIAVTPIYSCTLSFLGVFVPLPCQYVSYFMSWLICGFD